jgi:hypothetical protein
MKTAREFQIEFERRITLMNPNFELKEKLTSDTIFSFLNAYVERFVRNNYLQEDQVGDNTRAQKKNADALKGLIVRTVLSDKTVDEDNSDQCTDKFILPTDYFLYIRSNSHVASTYKTDVNQINGDTSNDYLQIAPNKTISEDDVEKILSTYYNRAILLNPYVVLNAGQATDQSENIYLNVIHDTYTTVSKIDLVYYRKPKKFNVIGVDGVNVLDHCELPENVHMEIVEGAVEMFITEAKYRLNMKQSNE